MKTHFRAGLAAITLLFLLTGTFTFGTSRARAEDDQPPGPDRFTVMIVKYTTYKWWLVRWLNSAVLCQISIEHKGLPTPGEIYGTCGEDLYKEWIATSPCANSQVKPSNCEGDYLEFVKSTPSQRKVGISLPPPVVWVTLNDCTYVDSTNRCAKLPTLLLTGEEPLPNEHITHLGGTVNGKPFTCDPLCQVDLAPTGESGIPLQFWAYSSYGDSSEVFDAQVRVMADSDPDTNYWYVDILSTQWRGASLAACSQTWNAFPPVGGTPAWLSTPQTPQDLASDIPYEYLAANLITQGVVDASSCADGGLLENGLASPCGLDVASPAVTKWQNRFDKQIFRASQKSGVPAQLLKNIFSRESQFWPGIFTGHPETGLGQLTVNGADTTLLWNPSFYEQFCPLVLADDVCRKGYTHLKPEQQDTLRAALVHKVDASCSTCPLGLDLTQADLSITVYTETLEANCEQTGMIIHNASYQTPGDVSSYEDLWRFTLVNYNAGPGCLTLAVKATVSQGDPLDWQHVSSNLTPVCQGAIDYVSQISR